jgi:hypothetical protein
LGLLSRECPAEASSGVGGKGVRLELTRPSLQSAPQIHATPHCTPLAAMSLTWLGPHLGHKLYLHIGGAVLPKWALQLSLLRVALMPGLLRDIQHYAAGVLWAVPRASRRGGLGRHGRVWSSERAEGCPHSALACPTSVSIIWTPSSLIGPGPRGHCDTEHGVSLQKSS